MSSDGFDDTDLNKLLRELTSKQSSIETCVNEIQKDLKNHIKNVKAEQKIHKEEIDWLKNRVYFAQGAIALISLAATLWKFGIL